MGYDFDAVINRRGTFCTQWDYIEDRFGEKDLLPFSISDTDFQAPGPIREKLHEMVSHGIYGYSRWNHETYKGAIAGYFRDCHGVEISQDWVVYSPSVLYSIAVLLRLLSQAGDSVLVMQPMYDAFFRVVQENDRRLIACELVDQDGHYEIDFEDFEKKAAESQIFLLCSPHNPTGRVWTKEEMDRMMEICSRYGLPVISDEIHADVILGENRHITAASYQEKYPVYVVSSPSKTFNTPGLGGSYGLLPEKSIREAFVSRLRNQDFLNSVSLPGMYAAIAGYNQCMDYAAQLSKYVLGNMRYLKERIDGEMSDLGVRFTIPEATYLAWIDVRRVNASDEEIQKALIATGKVGIMPGKTYGGPGYLRMNLGCPRTKLADGIERMKKGLLEI